MPKTYKRTFKRREYSSGDGMLTTIWGPSMWHFLHTMSFNYPVKPSREDKTHYRDFILNLKNILPCKYCRQNLKRNLKVNPLTWADMENRDRFSRYIYKLHEMVNKLLGKTSGLSYCDVRERYEHFRSRCTKNDAPPKLFNFSNKKEKGCTEPLYGHKAKCVMSIVPQTTNIPSFQIDNKCVKYKVEKMKR